MKIAILLRGQPRQIQAGMELLNHFTINRFPQHEFTLHIHSWNSVTGSTAGLMDSHPAFLGVQHLINLFNSYRPHTLYVFDDRYHYNNYIMPVVRNTDLGYPTDTHAGQMYWKTSQMIGHYIVQSNLSRYCEEQNYRPDLIIDTRTDMCHWISESALEDCAEYVNENPEHILVNRRFDWSGYPAVSDENFLYSTDHLNDITRYSGLTRYNTGFKNIDTHKDLIGKDIWNSHTLWPILAFPDRELVRIEDITSETFLFDRLHSSNLAGTTTNISDSESDYYGIVNRITSNDQRTDANKNPDWTRLHNTLYSEYTL